MSQYKQITSELLAGVTIVRLRQPELRDLGDIEQFGRELYAVIDHRPAIKLVIDFSGVEFLSSAAIGKLIAAGGRAKSRQGVMKLCNVAPAILDVFHVCQLDRILPIRRDCTDAIESLELLE